jgi:hypothetical protein
MLTPERRVKDKVKKVLKELGAYYAMPATGGYGSSGVPDFLVCLRGRFIGIECKANGGKPTALQEKNLDDIRKNNGIAFVVDENNVGDLLELMSAFFTKGTE